MLEKYKVSGELIHVWKYVVEQVDSITKKKRTSRFYLEQLQQ